MLKVNNLTKYFGGLVAVNDVDFHVAKSEILGLIGPNGAGKSTLFNLIAGLLKPTKGRVIFENKDITGFSTHEIAQLGIDLSFQASTLFTRLSVLNNVFVGYHMRYQTRIWKRLLRTSSALKEEREFRRNAMEILEFMGLKTIRDELAENLSHGDQKVLIICMAMATNPKLLLLDEPVAGISQNETKNMVKLIKKIRDSGVTIVVVEHDMKVMRSLCDRIVVLNYGRKLMEGSPKEVLESEEVIEAYLGTAEI